MNTKVSLPQQPAPYQPVQPVQVVQNPPPPPPPPKTPVATPKGTTPIGTPQKTPVSTRPSTPQGLPALVTPNNLATKQDIMDLGTMLVRVTGFENIIGITQSDFMDDVSRDLYTINNLVYFYNELVDEANRTGDQVLGNDLIREPKCIRTINCSEG